MSVIDDATAKQNLFSKVDELDDLIEQAHFQVARIAPPTSFAEKFTYCEKEYVFGWGKCRGQWSILANDLPCEDWSIVTRVAFAQVYPDFLQSCRRAMEAFTHDVESALKTLSTYLSAE